MTTYSLLPKLNAVGTEIRESSREFVLYRHEPSETVEINVVKEYISQKFFISERQAVAKPWPLDQSFLDQLNNKV